MLQTNGIKKARQDLLHIYLAALKRVNGQTCVRAHLEGRREKAPLSLVAIGKAAQAMAQGACDALGERIVEGLVISKPGHLDSLALERTGLKGLEGGHPIPNEQSLAAGEALLKFLAQQPADRSLLFLISGGTSSLVEVLPDGVTLEHLRRVNQWLLGSGLPISAMNYVRKRLSTIKGGGLLQFIGDRPCEILLISDVPGDDPAVIGSGLLVPDHSSAIEPAALDLPEWLQTLREQGQKKTLPIQTNISLSIVANLAMACRAAEEKALELGYQVYRHKELLEGDAEQAGHRLAQAIIERPPGVHIWGGETTVRLPSQPGLGGRNQHLALAAALEIAGRDNIYLLAAGTDGNDGPTDDAGALVDGSTLARAAIDEFNGIDCLSRADAGRLLAASGDLINTGPTGTNVMDLVIGISF